MAEAPSWLLKMRSMNGLSEKPGAPDEAKILAMADEIARIYPEMKSYCDQYNHDSVPWCGLTTADCMAVSGIRPPFGATDTDRFLWARSWADDPGYIALKTPRLGCVVVLTRSGGGHVTFYESTRSDGMLMCRGGNQADRIGLNAFSKSSVIGYFWPRDASIPEPVVPPATVLPTLRKGSTGPNVVLLQTLLPKWVDGDFGSVTDSLVREFQRSEGLAVDGIVGEATWAALLDETPPPGPTPTPNNWVHAITATVFGSFEGEQSAYGGSLDDSKPFVAVPWRIEGKRPRVELMNADGEIFSADIMDVGPWMTTDNYIATRTRPVAEQCFASKTPIPSGPQKGRVPSNPAGIDLSPSLAKSLGIAGMGKVSWRFMTS